MTNSNLVKINFCFPSIPKNVLDKAEFVSLLINHMEKNGSIDYAGYLQNEDLYRDLLLRIGGVDIENYDLLSIEQKKLIEKTISSTIEKCSKELPLPIKPIYVFIFPWFPDVEDQKLLGGINAVAPYVSTIHIFLAPKIFSEVSLRETVAHELNHLIFYSNHEARKYTLFEKIMMEGLADNFREEIIGGESAAWSIALTQKRSAELFQSLKPILNSKSSKVSEEVLYGSKKYVRWSGYSIGYWIVKNFRKKYPQLTWQEIMQMEVEHILKKTL